MNGLRLCRRIGAFVVPSYLAVRPTDGVRGLFAAMPLREGDVIGRVPLSSCVRLDSPRTDVACRALPSFALWKRQFQLLTRENGSVLSLESVISSDDSPTGVLRFAVSINEAALATTLGWFHFWKHVACVDRYLLPGDALYLSTFPIDRIHNYGSEAPYHLLADEEGDSEHGLIHSCMEQIAQSIVDVLREYVATFDQLRIIDALDNELLWVILSALYAVRARVLSLPVVPAAGETKTGAATPRQSLVVPIVQLMNHASNASCTAVVCPAEGSVFIRTLRHIAPGDELTLRYGSIAQGGEGHKLPQRPRHRRRRRQWELRRDDSRAWESRYLLNRSESTR